MKSIISDKPKSQYPYLGVFKSGDVVLFTGPRCGVCVVAGTKNSIGEYDEHWREEEAVFYKEHVTLSN